MHDDSENQLQLGIALGFNATTFDPQLDYVRAAERLGYDMRVGGYRSSSHNFHKDAMARRGHEEEAEKIQELFLAGKREEAIATVPDAYIDESSLIGDEARIRNRFRRYSASLATSLRIMAEDIDTLELMADVAGLEPR